MLGTTEILLIAGVIILIFGASAIPKFAKSLGQAKMEFEKGIKEGANSAQSKDTVDSKVENKEKSDKDKA